jgi:cell division protein FtsZ
MVNFDNENLMEITPCVEGQKHKNSSIIKVMGVGGGGSNAVRHMYNMGITDVDFMICNTDRQALESNPIPIKIQLGDSGLGAGADPEVARTAARESEEQIKIALEGTKMLFITAGMGGGTGTGASTIIASIAREMGILTVAIVTSPFKFEQKDELAKEGIDELGQNVDALIVIKNEYLKNYYPDLKITSGFAKVDDVLLTAVKSIAEIITLEYKINLDFNDVKTILKDGGIVIISSGEAEGEGRAIEAVEAAINSPLLDQNSIYGAEKLLFLISYSNENEPTVDELDTIAEELLNKTCTISKKVIWGHGFDDSLGDKVRVTVIATGLPYNKCEKDEKKDEDKIIVPVDDNFVNTGNENRVSDGKIVENLFNNFPDNSQLRGKSEDEITEYLNIPAYYREQQLKKHSIEEISNYRAGERGLECAVPTFLSNAVD